MTTANSDENRAGEGQAQIDVPFAQLLRVFAWIGVVSFGGAAAQIAMMHRAVVDERRWLSEAQYLHALNFCMLLPGPEAQQMATYIGWRTHGLRGGLASGLLFILPGALVMLALSFLFVMGQGTGAIEGVFFGIKAAVVAIVIHALIRIASRGLKSRALIAVSLIAFAAIMLLRVPFPLVVIASALLGALIQRPPSEAETIAGAPARQSTPWREILRTVALCIAAWWLPIALAALFLGPDHRIVEIGLLFSQLAVVSFGGAYALLAALTQTAVERDWVTTAEMMAGLGLAETTPGPTILVNQFVAFLAGMREAGGLNPYLAACLGALMALWATFAPSFLWIFAGAPFLEDLARNRWLKAALSGISAAIVGVIASVGFTFALHVFFGTVTDLQWGPLTMPTVQPEALSIRALGLAVLAAFVLFVLKRGLLMTVGVTALAGFALA